MVDAIAAFFVKGLALVESAVHKVYCILPDLFNDGHAMIIGGFDSLLGVVDSSLAALPDLSSLGPAFGPISSMMWVSGRTGLDEAIVIIAGALAIRFGLQLIPFIRVGA